MVDDGKSYMILPQVIAELGWNMQFSLHGMKVISILAKLKNPADLFCMKWPKFTLLKKVYNLRYNGHGQKWPKIRQGKPVLKADPRDVRN